MTAKKNLMKPTLFHIGYYKTGSTFLQRNLFGSPDSGFLAVAPDHVVDPMARARYMADQFICNDSGQIASPWQTTSGNLVREATALIGQKKGMPVISHERFLGYPFAAGLDAPMILKRIHKFCPRAKILIVTREQYSLIASSYMQYLRRGGTMSITTALTHKYDNRVAFFNQDYFFFDLAAQAYIDSFGKENVLVLPYELLKKDPVKFVNLIYEFCGNHCEYALPATRMENPSNSVFVESTFRWFNLFSTRNSLNAYSPVGAPIMPIVERAKRFLSAHISENLEYRSREDKLNRIRDAIPLGTFTESNKNLSEITSIDFSAYGYS